MNIFTGLINGMISGATPILLAALGGTYTYYAGIFNIAMEGMMLSGAFFAVLGSYFFNSWPFRRRVQRKLRRYSEPITTF